MFTRFQQFATLLLTAHFALISAGPVVLHLALDQHNCRCLAGDVERAANHLPTARACSCGHETQPVDRGPTERISDDSPCGLCDFYQHAVSSATPQETACRELQVAPVSLCVDDAFTAAVARPFWSRGPPTANQA